MADVVLYARCTLSQHEIRVSLGRCRPTGWAPTDPRWCRVGYPAQPVLLCGWSLPERGSPARCLLARTGLPVQWGERSCWGGERVEEAGAGHRLAVKWNVGERSRSKMMADNGVKPHTTVTVTTQSGLAPQVCLALMPLPSPWDGYRPKFAWDFAIAWRKKITNMWVETYVAF